MCRNVHIIYIYISLNDHKVSGLQGAWCNWGTGLGERCMVESKGGGGDGFKGSWSGREQLFCILQPDKHKQLSILCSW